VLDAQKASWKTKNRAEKAQGPQEAAPEEVKPASRTGLLDSCRWPAGSGQVFSTVSSPFLLNYPSAARRPFEVEVDRWSIFPV
jgi:hypothetical protein